MAVRFGLPVVLLLLVVVLSSAGSGSSTSFVLERSSPTSPHSHDRSRHARILGSSSSSSTGHINYRLDGSSESGLYYTKIYLGTPPQELKVVVDTGSNVLWVSCTSTGLQSSSRAFDPESSVSSGAVNCIDPLCLAGQISSDSYCSDDDTCLYSLSYGDGSSISGRYISDELHYEWTEADSVTTTWSASIVFGCNRQERMTSKMFPYVDGVMGLGYKGVSLMSQLTTIRAAPRAISHCLRRDGGGILTFGAAVAPNMVYTHLFPSKHFYAVNIQKVYINGLRLPVDSSVFKTSGDRGTFLDSGTTLAYLVEEAYDHFVHAVTDALPRPVHQLIFGENHCYSMSPSVVNDVFPRITLEFEGGATMVVAPEDYIHIQTSADGVAAWCLKFRRTLAPGMTVLGEVVLMNKIVVYDVEAGRIGWADSNCSAPLNVSAFDTGTTSVGVRVAHPQAILYWIAFWIFVAN